VLVLILELNDWSESGDEADSMIRQLKPRYGEKKRTDRNRYDMTERGSR
jgi:hypothetical protein